MITSKEIPPIFERCKEVFHVNWESGVAIAYGGIVYSKNPLPPDVIEHERVHLHQQEMYGVQEWWDRYLTDKDFRLSQELEAYKVQAHFLRTTDVLKQNYKVWKLEQIARDLSSALYGNMIDYKTAKKLLS